MTPAEAAVNIPPGYGAQPAWSDEFNTLSLDVDGTGAANWAPRFNVWRALALDGNGDKCVKEASSYTGKGGTPLNLKLHEVRRGVLSLYGRPIPADRRDQFWGYEAMCGMLDGSISHAQTYGYWEVKARATQVSRGHHVSFWLLPSDGSWPPELDLLELVGTNPTVPFAVRTVGRVSAQHATPAGPVAEFRELTVRRPEDWHVIGLQWKPDTVTWYLDGRQVYQLPAQQFGTKPMSLMVTSEVSGNWEGLTSSATNWPLELQVDYVRIYRPLAA
jgi:serralysin